MIKQTIIQTLTLRYRSDWCLINFFVLFLTHVRFTRGRIAIVTIWNKQYTIMFIIVTHDTKLSYIQLAISMHSLIMDNFNIHCIFFSVCKQWKIFVFPLTNMKQCHTIVVLIKISVKTRPKSQDINVYMIYVRN